MPGVAHGKRAIVNASRPRLDLSGWGLRGTAILYLLVMIALPVFVVFSSGLQAGLSEFWDNINHPQAVSALRVTLITATIMTVINVVMGTLTAYVLVTYRFPGKNLLDVLIDLPFAIPTLVTGIMLVLLYGPQTALAGFLQEKFDMRVLYARPGIVLALLFICYPFVIRAVQPVLVQLDQRQPEAAYTLGASGWYTFRRIVFPAIRPAMLTGGMLGFARALGEFGAIVIVAGNIPLRTQTAPVYIYGKVEAGDMAAASAVSVVLLAVALVVTLSVDWMQRANQHG
ncbi:MAG: sulfate ABC transporter permease subunit CysT [Anaerolineae bacterium]|nr:sulfate ABC transporter permease subunit CysT [Anaerolineae bacterium]